MSDCTLVFTEEERTYLANLLETALGNARVEVRHTRTEDFREKVRHEEELLRGLLTKLQQP